MRVLLTSTRGLGHLHPLLPLARAARARGDEVLLAVPPSAADAVAGFPTAATGDGSQSPEIGRVWAGMPPDGEPNTYVVAQVFGRTYTAATLETTGRIVEGFRPDLVISECLEFAGGLHAERLGVRAVSVVVGPLDLPGFDEQPLVAELNTLRAGLGLDPVGSAPWRRTPTATWLPPELTDLPGVIRYRYEDPEGPVAAPAPLPPGDRARLYATLGSAAGRTFGAVEVYRNLLEALGGLDADVLLTTGSMDTAELGPVPGNVRIAPYVPQAEAMRCDAVIAHGGSGTSTATLARGLPAVLVPMFADQPANAAAIAAAGAAVVVHPRAVARELPAAVDAVLHDPAYRHAAGVIAAAMAATPDAGAALQRLVAAPQPAM